MRAEESRMKHEESEEAGEVSRTMKLKSQCQGINFVSVIKSSSIFINEMQN